MNFFETIISTIMKLILENRYYPVIVNKKKIIIVPKDVTNIELYNIKWYITIDARVIEHDKSRDIMSIEDLHQNSRNIIFNMKTEALLGSHNISIDIGKYKIKKITDNEIILYFY